MQFHLAAKITHSVRYKAHPTLTASWRENTVARAVRPVELEALPSVGSSNPEVRVMATRGEGGNRLMGFVTFTYDKLAHMNEHYLNY